MMAWAWIINQVYGLQLDVLWWVPVIYYLVTPENDSIYLPRDQRYRLVLGRQPQLAAYRTKAKDLC